MSNFSRRAFTATLLPAAAAPLLPLDAAQAQEGGSVPRLFKVEIPQATFDRILARVRDTRWPERLEAADWRYGANWDYMKSLAQYWTERFDWREAEANLNRHPQFLVRLGDFDIHYYHVKGRGPKPMPLILTHGWPASTYEFLEAIGPLTDPQSFGGTAEDAFDVVIPSLPGFGFSSKPKGKPIGAPTTAALWNRLMTEVLGYGRYGAQGGDVGSVVTAQLARQYPERLVGAHFNGISGHRANRGGESLGKTIGRLYGDRARLFQRTAAQASDHRLPVGRQSARHRGVDGREIEGLE
jgi:hypothetical protein